MAGYAVLDNHLHVMLKLNDKTAAGWTDDELVRRWGDNLDRVTTSHYTDLGQLGKTIGPAVNGQAVITEYDYDNAGNLIMLTDPSGNQAEWFYDARNRQRFEKITVDGQDLWRSQAWSDNDMIYQSRDRNNIWTVVEHEFAYGAAGNYVVTDQDYMIGSSVIHSVDYDYHQGNGPWLTDVSSSGTGGQDKIKFDYDDLGRLVSTTDFIDGTGTDTFEVTYNYDEIDRRQETEFLLNDVYDSSNWYYWDAASRLKVFKQFTPDENGFKYDPDNYRGARIQYLGNGQIASVERWQGFKKEIEGDSGNETYVQETFVQKSIYQAHDAGWVPGMYSHINHMYIHDTASGNDSASGNDNSSQKYDWDYNDVGLVTSYTTPDSSKAYGYDDTNQLTSVTTDGVTETFNYDGNGNRTESEYVIGDHNRLINDGTYTYEYDNEGNRTKRTLNSDPTGQTYDVYDWNHRNQLTGVASYDNGSLDQHVECDYDALNRRIRRRVDSDGNGTWDVKQRFLYDTNVLNPSFDEVVLILDELNNDEVTHRFFNGPFPDQVFSVENAAGEIFWYLHDHQNTVVDVIQFEDTNTDGVNDRAVLLNHLEYDGHGNITSQSDDTYQPLQTYTGQILDDATGLMYYDARWFDPSTNQFVNEDPMGFAAGDTNLRRYVGNSNPNATDPTGLYDEAGHFFTTYSVAMIVG